MSERRDNEFFALWVRSPRACAPNSCFERIVDPARLHVPGATDRSGVALLAADFCPSAHNGSHFALAHGAKCELPCAGGYSTPTGSLVGDRTHPRSVLQFSAREPGSDISTTLVPKLIIFESRFIDLKVSAKMQ